MTTVRDRVAMPQKGTVSSRTVVLIGLGWLVLATGVGAFGIASTLRPPALPLVLFGLTAVVLGAGRVSTGFRAWLLAIDVRWLVPLHLTPLPTATRGVRGDTAQPPGRPPSARTTP